VLYIGTDEAGYGPLLGPLVIVAAVYETDAPRDSLPGEGIEDSKVVYNRGGRDALARVLGPYLGHSSESLTLTELLERVSVRSDPRDGYAWYGEVRDDAAVSGDAPASFRRLFVNPVCERDFNEGCAKWGGKGGVLFCETMRVIREALRVSPGGDVDIVCDKHGGRNRYAAQLMAEFVPSTLIAERESAGTSRYRMTVDGRSVRIRFDAKADRNDTPVALASMAAKYVRELFMEGLNAFFAARIEGLRPTAGYYTDGRRFLDEIRPVLDEMAESCDGFVRVR